VARVDRRDAGAIVRGGYAADLHGKRRLQLRGGASARRHTDRGSALVRRTAPSPLDPLRDVRQGAAVAKVELTRHLHTFFPQLADKEIVVEASTVAEVVAALERLAPGFAFYVCDERGRLRTHVNIFIGQERVADRHKLSDRVEPDARVYIMQALSGG
jgi:hypothetical protein